MTRGSAITALLAMFAAGGTPLAQPATQPSLPRLAGVVVSNEGRRAIFAEPDGSFSVAEGEWLGAYAVVAITPGTVQLHGPEGICILHPAPAAEAGTALTASPPQPSPADARRQAEADNDK